jgi:hypothetical protein
VNAAAPTATVTARKVAGRIKRKLVASARSAANGRRPAAKAPGPKALDAGDRLVPSPVFVYCSERSGSTLLRMILDSHSQICAPHELHMRTLRVNFSNWYGETAWKKLGVKQEDLRFLLWDRLLHLELSRTGKSVIADKTPTNLNLWRKINKSWPDAKYIFLKRHPLRIVESLAAASPNLEMEKHYERVNGYLNNWIDARAELPGPTVSYEELTADPERIVRLICKHLGVAFEPAMLDYSRVEHTGDFRRGLGDWNEKIKSGVIQPADPPPRPEDVPDGIREVTQKLGYL